MDSNPQPNGEDARSASLVEAPKLRCLACEGYLVPRRHSGQQHVEPAYMCGSTVDECILSGVCLPCQRLIGWFQDQNDRLGPEGA